MNNNDFRAMLTGGDLSKSSNENKNRIDIKQFSKWDKEFKKKNEKKMSNKYDDNKEKSKANTTTDGAEASKYRDRASERRNNMQGGVDQELEELVSNMPSEQTKYFGGDEKSTHLVKGLDYLLLQRMREQAGESDTRTDMNRVSSSTSYQPITEMGVALKEIISKKHLKEKVTTPFHRTTYEFHFMDSHEAPELPVLVYKSVKELNIQTTSDNTNNNVRNTVNNNILTRLHDIRSSSGFKMKRKRDEISQPQANNNYQPIADSKPMITDIYGDMFDVGPYVPVATSKPKVDAKTIIKDIFSRGNGVTVENKEKNYMDTVQSLVQNQAIREENKEMTVEEGKVHRSIFDASDHKKSKIEKGDRFVTNSDYNIEFADVDDHD